MKKLLFISFLFSWGVTINAQTWASVGAGLNYGGYVNTLYVYDSVMYVGGLFTSPGKNIAQWNGTKWDSLGSGIDNEASAVCSYKDNIYIGGYFSQAGGRPAGCIATWNGSAFINAGINLEGGGVNCLQAYDSLLYIGGNEFDSVNHKPLATPGIAAWDGAIVKSVGSPYSYTDITSLATYNGALYLGQAKYYSDYVLGCNNVNEFSLGYPFGTVNSTTYSIAQFALATGSGNLYAGGIFYETTTNRRRLNNIAQWNGSSWLALGSGINGVVYALVTYKNLLFAGGDFDSAGGVAASNIAVWNGTSWSAAGSGFNGPVYALAIFDSTLYAGGDFTSPGNGIAKFTHPLDLGINKLSNNNYSMHIYPNPSDGIFTVLLDPSTLVSSSTPIAHPNMIIYNILGEKIYSATLLTENTSVDLRNQPLGIYLYRIVSPNGDIINSGKLIVE